MVNYRMFSGQSRGRQLIGINASLEIKVCELESREMVT